MAVATTTICEHCRPLPRCAAAPLRCTLLVTVLSQAARGAGAAPPSAIVFILLDDLGFNELGFQNASRGLLTPNIDALASGGVTLSHYYTPSLCSPTRSALMTGRYSHRLGTQANVVYWDTPWAVPRNETFLPQRLAALNYSRRGMFGKWHLGMHTPWALPINRGFTAQNGYMQGCQSYATHVAACCTAPANASDFAAYVCPAPAPQAKDYRGYDWFVGAAPDVAGSNGTASSALLAERASAFVADAAAAGERFFLYVPFQNIHAPYDARADSIALFSNRSDLTPNERVMFAYIHEVDTAIGRIIASLRGGGVYGDSVIVLASDNGAPEAAGVAGRNWPLRGFKQSTWEGGTRVPALVHAPGRLAPGRRVDALAHVTDWAPTLVALAGGGALADVDGHDLWPVLSGGGAPARSELVYNINPLCGGGQFDSPKAAIRVGDMKLLCWCYSVAGIANATTTQCEPDPAAPRAWPQLYNLSADVGEAHNLAAVQPAVVAQLEARLAELAAASVEPMVWEPPYQGHAYYCADCPLHPATGPYEPWVSWIADDYVS